MLELLGLLLPPFIDIFNRKVKNSDVRLVVSMGVCIVIGILIHLWGNAWVLGTQDEVAISILSVFGAAQVSFKLVWDESNIRSAMGVKKIPPKR